MKITKPSTFANTAIVANVTYRMVGTYGVSIAIGMALFFTPLFKWNWPAIASYIAFSMILIGQTPTKRSTLLNLYGLLLKRPQRMVVSNLATANTLGHGIRNILFLEDVDAPAFQLLNRQYAFVYNVTSNLTQWSEQDDFKRQAKKMKSLFNIFEGGESLMIVTKQDADTGMLQLENALAEEEHYEGDDLDALSRQRRGLLHRVATERAGRSVQQYAILQCKPKNMHRCLKELHKSARLIVPASHPADVLLSAMGLEAGSDQDLDEQIEQKRQEIARKRGER